MPSIFKKYESYLVDFKDYRKGSIKNLAYMTNTQTNTAKLIKGGLFCGKTLTQYTTIPDNTQFALGRDPFVMFACFQSMDTSGIHHVYSVYGTAAQPRIIIRRAGASTNDLTIVDSAGNSASVAAISVNNNERVCLFFVVVPSANKIYTYKNGAYVGETNIAALVGNFSITSGNTIGLGVGRTADMNEIMYYCGTYKNLNLTANEVAQLYSELEVMPESRTVSKDFDYNSTTNVYTTKTYYKGEMGILCDEVVTSLANSHISNSGFQIAGGNHLMVAEKNNNKLEKCLSGNGNSYLKRAVSAYGKWHFKFYLVSGSSVEGVHFITDQTNTTNDFFGAGYGVWFSSDTLIFTGLAIPAQTLLATTTNNTWYDIYIERSVANEFKIWVDGVLKMTYTNATYTTSIGYIIRLEGYSKLVLASEDEKLSFYHKA